ncbi:hypothetical protein GCM10011405_06520 [Rufibacter glacialis]|nr:hypothetical protein GCM10011405_06520 [Rufibacter glacialis]
MQVIEIYEERNINKIIIDSNYNYVKYCDGAYASDNLNKYVKKKLNLFYILGCQMIIFPNHKQPIL